MYLLRIPFSMADGIILLAMAVIIGFIIHFVLANRRSLQAMIEESKKQNSLTGSGGRYPEEILKTSPVSRKKRVPEMAPAAYTPSKQYRSVSVPAATAVVPDVLQDLKQSIRQQQKTLDQLLNRVDRLDTKEEHSQSKAGATDRALEEKEEELQRTRQQLSASLKVAGRVTEVYQEFDQLQQKMAELEESASKSTALEMELEDMQQAYEQLKKDLYHSQEKLHLAVEKSGQLHQQLAETEDKLSESNLLRQQLQKKVQLLENINTELQQMSDVNKRLKNEVRRIAELESMLSLVSDERDLLLKKRIS